MIRYNIAYRHTNGEVEGFTATRFAEDRAEQACLETIRIKCRKMGHTFDPKRIISNTRELTKKELKTVQADWQIVFP